MDLTTAEIVRILVVAVVLLAALGLLKWLLKLTTKILTIGCFAVVIIVAIMVILGFVS